ncbi:MAG: hypothetical protein Roseis2KO_60290 [Roseivirga sp.]
MTGCNEEYFQSASGITLPEGTIRVDCFDNLEWRVEATFQLPQVDLEDFLSENAFEKMEGSLTPDSLFYLTKEHRQIPNNGHLYSITYSTPARTHWRYVLNKQTGKLWTFINYPDWGGT